MSVLSIAVGMSVAIAVFGVVNAVLFRPLPFLDADRLVTLFVSSANGPSGRFSFLHAMQRGEAEAIRGAAAYSTSPAIVGESGDARTLMAARVSVGFLDVIGIRPVIGSDFDQRSGGRGDPSVLVSHGLWMSLFGAGVEAVGRRIVVDGRARTIIGVMPERFDFPSHASVWLPMATPAEATARPGPSYWMLARIRGEVPLETVASQVAVVHRRLLDAVTPDRVEAPTVVTLRGLLTGSLRDQLELWIAVAVLIAILCAVNFATMSFARGTARRHELAVRRAIGASGPRVILELMREAATVALVGGVVAIPLAAFLMRFADVWLADSVFVIAGIINWQIAIGGVLAAAIIGIAFAALPAADAAMVDIRSVMQTGGPGSTSRKRELRSRRALVGFQVTLALTASALVTALAYADRRYQQSEVRIDVSRLLLATVSSADTGLGPIELRPLTARLSQAPGLVEAGALNACDEAAVTLHGERRQASAFACNTSTGFLNALGLKTLAGRLPTRDEVSSRAPVVVLTRAVAAQLFGTSIVAPGHRIVVNRTGWDPQPREVVGVVDDIGNGLFGFTPGVLRVQDIAMRRTAVLVVRTAQQPASVLKDFGAQVRAVDSRAVVSDVVSAADHVSRGRLKMRGRTYFMVSVASLAVLLAIIGVFSLTAYSTTLRVREFGIRAALGATPRAIVWLVVREMRWSAAVGLITGVITTVLVTSWLDEVLRPTYMTRSLITLPVTALVAGSAALFVIMSVGTAIPIRRLLRMDVGRSLAAL